MKTNKITRFSTLNEAGFACLVTVGLFIVGVKPAQAQVQSSRVDSVVTELGNSSFSYDFELFNTSDVGFGDRELIANSKRWIVNWELPLFSLDDLDVNSVVSPRNWTFEIVELDGTIAYSPTTNLIGSNSEFFNNSSGVYGNYGWDYVAAEDPLLIAEPDLYGENPEVFEQPPFILHWYTAEIEENDVIVSTLPSNSSFPEEFRIAPRSSSNQIFPQDSLNGFGFDSEFNSVNAPYLSSWFFLPPVSGDRPIPSSGFGTPNSPARKLAQSSTGTPTSVPEPRSILGLLALGTGLVSTGLKKRKFSR